MSMEISVFARLHARPGKRDEVRQANPFKITVAGQLW
jgi:hypothetical protein